MAIYVKCNNNTHTRNHCYRGKAISIKYYQRVSVYLRQLLAHKSRVF